MLMLMLSPAKENFHDSLPEQHFLIRAVTGKSSWVHCCRVQLLASAAVTSLPSTEVMRVASSSRNTVCSNFTTACRNAQKKGRRTCSVWQSTLACGCKVHSACVELRTASGGLKACNGVLRASSHACVGNRMLASALEMHTGLLPTLLSFRTGGSCNIRSCTSHSDKFVDQVSFSCQVMNEVRCRATKHC